MELPFIYGCMGIGGGWTPEPITDAEMAHSMEALEQAWETGFRWFDHADIYTFGKAEAVFGEFLRQHPDRREQMIIQTKAGIRIDSGPNGSNTYCLTGEYLTEKVEQSLERLDCGYIDVFMLHRPDPLMDPIEMGRALHEIKKKGWVRHFGVSNFSAQQQKVLQRELDFPLQYNQLRFSLGYSGMLDALLGAPVELPSAYADPLSHYDLFASGRTVMQAWGALDQGRFAGRPERAPDDISFATRKVVQELTEKYGTNPYAILLSWILAIPFPIKPVIGTTQPERISACAEGATVKLSREDWYRLWITARGRNLP